MCRRSVFSTSRASVPMASVANTCREGWPYSCRHVVYDDGAIPTTVDISARAHESEIDMREKNLINSGIRRNKCNSYEENGRCVYGENCIYCHELLDLRSGDVAFLPCSCRTGPSHSSRDEHARLPARHVFLLLLQLPTSERPFRQHSEGGVPDSLATRREGERGLRQAAQPRLLLHQRGELQTHPCWG